MDLREEKLLIFDIESTGMNTERDQIVELTVQSGLAEDSPGQTWRIKPDVPISPGAQAVHGIKDADLASCPRFKELAPEIRIYFEQSRSLVGYNVEFDLKLLQAEFRRIKQSEIDLSQKLIVDPLLLWRKCEPRRLEDACTRFVGKPHTNAHSSAADVAVTGLVLLGMLKTFGLEKASWPAISEMSSPTNQRWIGPSHHIQWRNDIVVFGFGRHSGRPVSELASEENGGYLKWILDKDFPEHVKIIAKRALQNPPTEFSEWVVAEFAKRA